MSVVDIVAAIQTVNSGIGTVAQAPTVPPLTLDGATLPVALVRPGPARWQGGGGLRSKVRARRTYTMLFFLAATSPDSQNDADMQAVCFPAIEDVMEVWRFQHDLGDPQIALIQHRDTTTESLTEYGPTVLAYGSDSTVYYGFLVDLVLWEIAT